MGVFFVCVGGLGGGDKRRTEPQNVIRPNGLLVVGRVDAIWRRR